MSALAAALLAELSNDRDALQAFAEQLAPLLADKLGQSTATDGWLRGADQIAAYVAAPRSRIYALVSAKRIPVQHDGSNLVARKSELDAWLRAGGAKRP